MFFSYRPMSGGTVSYLFGCGSKGKAMAVDIVLGDENWFEEEAHRGEVSLSFAIDIHLHADHHTGGPILVYRTGAEYALHEVSSIEFDTHRLRDKELLDIGNVSVQILHTPGHTLDSICLLVSDRHRSEEPWF